MADTSTLATAAATAFGAALLYLGQRLTARVTERNARDSTAATVEVARIEAHTATEAHVWEWLEQERRNGSELSATLRLCEKRANDAESALTVERARAERLQEERDYLLSLVATAGIESHLTRIMHEEMERRGSTGHTLNQLLPELCQERRPETAADPSGPEIDLGE